MTLLPPKQAKVLDALDHLTRDDYYIGFKFLSVNTGLDVAEVRRLVRALARKGLAAYGRGLWSEDGGPAGSGYRCTKLGRVIAKELRP